MDANAAAARMLSHSDDFFTHYPVQMAGGTGTFVPNTANLKIYRLAKKDAGMPGTVGNKEGHFGATRPGFLHTKNISSFKMDELIPPNCSLPLNTHGVPMVNYNSDKDKKVNLHENIVAMDHYAVGAGADYMTTGLLTGCCFAWYPAPAGGLWCIHIRPEGTDGNALHNMVADHGRFAAAPNASLSTYGRNDYGGNYAMVIGVRTPGGWKLYAQTSLDTFKTINGAWRLHPGAVTRLA